MKPARATDADNHVGPVMDGARDCHRGSPCRSFCYGDPQCVHSLCMQCAEDELFISHSRHAGMSYCSA